MAVTDKGFLSTLEAVIASTIFFIFLFTAAPTFVEDSNGTQEMAIETVDSTIQSLVTAGSLRQHIIDRNISTIEDKINDYAASFNIAIGILYTESIERSFSGQNEEYSIETDNRPEQATLRLWIDNADNLEARINNQTVIQTSESGYHERDVTDSLSTGINTLNMTADSASLDLVLDQYLYQQSQSIPKGTAVLRTRHHIAGTNTTFAPAELRVFLWQ